MRHQVKNRPRKGRNMESTNVVHKFVNDLGIAAYVLMHGYCVIGKKGRSIYFECQNKKEAEEFDKLVLEYQPPNEFYTLDSCLMFLKKINELIPVGFKEDKCKVVSDLGVAAYLLMQKYKDNSINCKVVAKKGKYVFFEVPEENETEFDRLSYRYLPSPFQTYDSNLMALKKIGEYMPDRQIY